jgi:spore maturation protein CgeB
MKDKISFYLKNDSLREKISLQGYEDVMKYHTCEKRVIQFEGIVYENII